MDLRFSSEDRQFAETVRTYLSQNLPDELARKVRYNQRLTREDYVQWQDILAAANWYAIGWPAEHGGPALTPTQRYLFDREYGALPCPRPSQFGIAMAGPVIYTFGTDEQKSRFLPGIRENRDFWCQGYSEPGAGSDLAALKTSAVRDGDDYVINGQKIWTTWANWADWMFCLVKTDANVKPQLGISFLLVDMKTPGITVNPIKTLDGDVEFNEVFFDNVRVPAENMIGQEGEGWTFAKFLLEHERFSMSGSAFSKRVLGELQEDAVALGRFDDPFIADRFTRLEVELLALEYMELRMLARSISDDNLGPEASKLKIRGTEIAQALTQLRIDIHQEAALFSSDAFLDGQTDADNPSAAGAIASYLNQRKLTIWGGSNEIQRMILAKQILGLK